MSVNRSMQEYVLQEKTLEKTVSGAGKEVWKDKNVICVSVRKVNELRVAANIKYGEASHTGLTYEKDIRKNVNRLIREGIVYNILDANTESRLTNLVMKVVDEDV